jgi:hypothetical protein
LKSSQNCASFDPLFGKFLGKNSNILRGDFTFFGGKKAKSKGNGWLSWAACYCSSLGSNPDISQKYKMGDTSKEVANTLAPQKIYKMVKSGRNYQHFKK